VPAAEDRTTTQPAAGRDRVFAWQQAALNLNAVCDQCNAVLAKGQLAAIGIPIPERPVFLCLECLAGLGPQVTPTASGE
jgi:hypothetical protein